LLLHGGPDLCRYRFHGEVLMLTTIRGFLDGLPVG
jgi:hypothetical protein